MNAVKVKNTGFFKKASYFLKHALIQADEGDLQSCAGLNLRGLDKERRALMVILHVLQLIKSNN